MLTLLFFITSIIAMIVAVKLAATYLKTTKHDWLSVIITVAFSLVVINSANHLIPLWYVAIAASIVIVGFVIESVLETKLPTGMIIAVVAILTQLLVKFGFMSMGVSTDFLVLIQQIIEAK